MKLVSLIACVWLGTASEACAINRTAGNTAPGSSIPPGGGLLRLGAANNLAADEDFLRCVVSDPATKTAWFGTSTSPGQVIKVAYDGPAQTPRRIASLILEPGEDLLFTGVIDVTAGYAYFGTFTAPGRIVKVALGSGSAPPVRIGAVTLGIGEQELMSSVIDTGAGYAYFGARTSPGRVVKIKLGQGPAAPTRVGVAPLAALENILRAAVIDPVAGYAWFGTFTDPARVVKVALGTGDLPPARVHSVTLDPGENRLVSAVLDSVAGQAWFGTNTTPGKVVKVELGAGSAPPSRIGAVTLDPGEGFLTSAATTAGAPGYALFGTDTLPGAVVKVALGTGMNPPTRVGTVTLPSGEENSVCAADLGGSVFFGTNTQPGQVVQIAPGSPGQPPVHESALPLGRGENALQSVVIDAVNGYGWFGAATFPGQIIKVKLGRAGQPPQRIASLMLEPTESRPICAVADVTGGYAWFGTDTGPSARVVKIALGAGDNPPVRLGALTLDNGERNLRCAAVDLANRYAYFGTAVLAPGKVVKVALGDGTNPPTRVGAASFNADEWDFQSAVIDATGTYALFGTGQYLAETGAGGKVVKVALGSGASPPTRVGVVPLQAEEESLHAAVNDPASGYAWFGAVSPGFVQNRVIKVAFEPGAAPPRRVGSVMTNTGGTPFNGGLIDVPAGYLVFGGGPNLAKVALGAGDASPVSVGALALPPAENGIHCGTGDPLNGLGWFGLTTSPGNVVLASYSQKGFIKGTKVILPESGTMTGVHFYSHRALGNVRLALYLRNGLDRNLTWQSGPMANVTTNGWIDVPVSQGTPPGLPLTAGSYELTWQVDTTSDVPSYLAGSTGDGFRLPADFGAFPALLTEGTGHWETTAEAWASYLSYDIPEPAIIEVSVSGDILTLVWTSNPGTWYQLQSSSDLSTGSWAPLGTPIRATGLTTSWSEPGVTTHFTKFYRLEVP